MVALDSDLCRGKCHYVKSIAIHLLEFGLGRLFAGLVSIVLQGVCVVDNHVLLDKDTLNW